MDNIRPIKCQFFEEGLIFKSSYKRYLWEFYIDNELVKI